jgi:hypothetical protein
MFEVSRGREFAGLVSLSHASHVPFGISTESSAAPFRQLAFLDWLDDKATAFPVKVAR